MSQVMMSRSKIQQLRGIQIMNYPCPSECMPVNMSSTSSDIVGPSTARLRAEHRQLRVIVYAPLIATTAFGVDPCQIAICITRACRVDQGLGHTDMMKVKTENLQHGGKGPLQTGQQICTCHAHALTAYLRRGKWISFLCCFNVFNDNSCYRSSKMSQCHTSRS
jgi:hypothetical protein